MSDIKISLNIRTERVIKKNSNPANTRDFDSILLDCWARQRRGLLVQQICGDNQPKGSVSDKSTKIPRKLAEMILFEISYGPKLN